MTGGRAGCVARTRSQIDRTRLCRACASCQLADLNTSCVRFCSDRPGDTTYERSGSALANDEICFVARQGWASSAASHDVAQATLACGHSAVAKAYLICSTVLPCSVAGTEAGTPTVSVLLDGLEQVPLAEEASLLTAAPLPAACDTVQHNKDAGTCRCVTRSNSMFMHLARVLSAASGNVLPVACRHLDGLSHGCCGWCEVGSKLVGCPVQLPAAARQMEEFDRVNRGRLCIVLPPVLLRLGAGRVSHRYGRTRECTRRFPLV